MFACIFNNLGAFHQVRMEKLSKPRRSFLLFDSLADKVFRGCHAQHRLCKFSSCREKWDSQSFIYSFRKFTRTISSSISLYKPLLSNLIRKCCKLYKKQRFMSYNRCNEKEIASLEEFQVSLPLG